MRHNQALANKQHDRQSLKDLQDAMLSCGSHIDLPVSHRFINGTFSRPLSIPIVLSNLSSNVWIGRLLP